MIELVTAAADAQPVVMPLSPAEVAASSESSDADGIMIAPEAPSPSILLNLSRIYRPTNLSAKVSARALVTRYRCMLYSITGCSVELKSAVECSTKPCNLMQLYLPQQCHNSQFQHK